MTDLGAEDVDDRPSRRAVHPALLVLAALTAFGAAVRAPGLTAKDLWYDDAWVALPAHRGLGSTLRLSMSAPGFGVLGKAWISVDPSSTTWSLLLPYLLACAVPVAVYAMGRTYRLSPWWSLGLASAVTVAPDAILYSTRFKPYSAEVLVSALLLTVTERFRLERSTRRLLAFTAVAVLGVALSAALIVVAVGCTAALVVGALRHRTLTSRVGVAAGVVTVACACVGVRDRASVPTHLHAFWTASHAMLAVPPHLSDLAATISTSSITYLHGALGLPIAVEDLASSTLVTSGAAWQVETILAVTLLVAGIAVPTLQLVVGRRDLRLLAPASVLAVAIAAWALGLFPFGTGRTDLYSYPAVGLLAAVALRVGVERWLQRRGLRVLAVVATAIAVVASGIHFRAWYPSQETRTIAQEVFAHRHPGDLLIVSHRNAYTWALDGLSHTTVVVARNSPESASVGYAIASTSPTVSIESPIAPSPLAVTPPSRATRIWVIATTDVNLSPSLERFRGAAGQRSSGGLSVMALGLNGWRVRLVLHAPGEIAYLLTPSAATSRVG